MTYSIGYSFCCRAKRSSHTCTHIHSLFNRSRAQVLPGTEKSPLRSTAHLYQLAVSHGAVCMCQIGLRIYPSPPSIPGNHMPHLFSRQFSNMFPRAKNCPYPMIEASKTSELGDSQKTEKVIHTKMFFAIFIHVRHSYN